MRVGERSWIHPGVAEMLAKQHQQPADVIATVSQTYIPRDRRRERIGWQGGMGCEQRPSGSGPSAHLPPAPPLRVHDQRSPLLEGMHSPV